MCSRSSARIRSGETRTWCRSCRLSHAVRDTAQKLVDMNMADMVSGHGKARQMAAAAKYAMHSMLVAGVCVAM